MNDDRPEAIALESRKQTAFLATLYSEAEILERIRLPWPPEGHYTVKKAQLSFEAEAGAWHLLCGNRTHVMEKNGAQAEHALLGEQPFLELSAPGRRLWLYSERLHAQSNLMRNYLLLSRGTIRVGGTEDCDIICRNGLLSPADAELSYDGRSLTVRDTGSRHGVYVRGRRAGEARLNVGDIVEIPGLRIAVGSGFLSVAEGNGLTFVSPKQLRRIDDPGALSIVPPRGGHAAQTEYFSPFPRSRAPMGPKTIDISPPPMSAAANQMPLWLQMGRTMTSGLHAAMMGNVIMMANSLLFPLLTNRFTKEEQEKHEQKRVEIYGAYLDAKWQELLDEKDREEQALRENYPPLSEVLTFSSDRKKLWSRRKTDDDFLRLRLGSGSYPLLAELDYPQRQFELEPDPLEKEMYDIIDRMPLLEDVPVMLDLRENRNVGVLGDREARLAFACSLMMRISMLYSCDEVKLMLLADPEDLSRLEFVRWLPHIWNDLRTVRYIAAEPSEAYLAGEAIAELLGQDGGKQKISKEALEQKPWYIVFALSRRLLESAEAFKTAMQSKDAGHVCVFALFDDLPKECSAIIRLHDQTSAAAAVNSGSIAFLNDPDRAGQDFTPDTCKPAAAGLSMRALYRVELKVLSQAYLLPKSYTFLEMFGVGRIEHLNVLERWRQNDPSRTLAVPVGIAANGEPLMLNLHQKHHGPHGLVAGTTGSGKSEFLITYILSLAVNFHPDEVAFLLIDYKGGGLAGAFADPKKGIYLPHLVGTITNLDGSAIMRSLTCIKSEMNRRQIVFNKAKSESGEGTMDIYSYQKLYRKRIVDEPLPHLFIIADEFAELRQQQPEFLDSLVSIARIGRSLGVHLILATQKPAGIVTGQIESNTKFRVCLKVQDRADSMDMLRRPDACELRETGRFYLQVGNNELFTLGQAAWCGAEYELTQSRQANQDAGIQVVDNTGASILNAAPEVETSSTGQSQLVAIVRMLSSLAKKEGIQRRELWMPPLPDKIDMDAIPVPEGTALGRIALSCGIIDDPAKQAQFPLTVDLAAGNLLLAGEPGSGKTTFLQSMLYTLSARYSPQQLNYYILDYSSRMLKLFSALPHCGAALTEDDENQLDAFFDLIQKLARERKELFSRLEVNGYEAACEIRQIPLILVIIDNLVLLGNTRKGQKHLDGLVTLIKNCGPCGIRFVISISHLNEATTRIKQEMPQRITLHMRDRYDYGDALNTRVKYVPPEKKGRGMVMHQERPLEVQMGMIAPELSEKGRTDAVKDRIAEIKERFANSPSAARIKTISASETYEDFCLNFSVGRIPLGYDLNTGHPVALPLKQFSMLTLYFGNPDSAAPVLNNFLYLKQRQDVTFVFMRRPEKSRFGRLKYTEGINALDATPGTLDQIANTLLWHVNERRKVFLQYCEKEGLDPEKTSSLTAAADFLRSQLKPLVVLFERMADLTDAEQKTEGLVSRLSAVYMLARYYQLYLIGCVYPDEDSFLYASKLYTSFNPDRLTMLFGGNLIKQRVLSVPMSIGKQDSADEFNRCLMSYRGEIHPLLMPCGILEKEILPEDDRPIFTPAESS